MNKIKYSTFVLSLIIATNVFAVTEQIDSAQKFLNTPLKNTDVIINNQSIITDKPTSALAPNKELKLGYKNELLKRLQSQIGIQETGVVDKDTFDYVRKFQKENDFNVTETLDYNTWFALFEQSDEWKKNIVESALKSWQNIITTQSKSKYKKFIVVNIPTMTLTAYDWDGIKATEAIQSRVILGKPTTQTPLRDFQIISIKYNPTWTPTDGILKRGAYKSGKLDINWVKKHGLTVFNESNEEVEIDNLNDEEKYHFQQPSGDKNALGVLKFETNSSDNIYLHDTNERYYFSYNTRTYSSGCIRVQKFKDLANWIRNANDVEEKLKRKDTYYEKVSKTPVYITYNQVIFFDDNPMFAPDIYGLNNNTDFRK